MGRKEYMNNHSYIKEYPAAGPRLSAAALLPNSDSRDNQGCGTEERIRAGATPLRIEPGAAGGGASIVPRSVNQGRRIENFNELNEPEKNNRTRGGRRSLISPRPHLRRPDGLSLLEVLISLSLSLLILVSALEVSVQARRVFVKLREAQEKDLGVAVALEKMREDLETAGAGIPRLLSGAGLSPVQLNGQTLVIFSAAGKTRLQADLSPGQSYLIVETNAALISILKKGRAIYLTDGNSGELVYISSVSGNSLAFSPALNTAFEAARTEVVVLEKIELYLDRQQKVLRRRVNSTTGQPLLEGAQDFAATYQADNNLASISLSIESGGKVHGCELVIFPKNLGRL